MSAHGRPWPTHRSLNWVWDTGTLTWVVMTQPSAGAGSATAANQVLEIASLASIDAKLTNPLPVSGTVAVTGVATAANQTSGGQKTQIVDAGNEAATVTNGRLDVNVGAIFAAVDANNTSVVALGSNASFTGTSTDVLGYASISVLVFADQNSATNGVKLEWSSDGSNWIDSSLYTFTAGGAAPNSGQAYQVGVRSRYFRVVYTNGASAQGSFSVLTILQPASTTSDIADLSLAPVDGQHAVTSRSVIYGKTTAGGGSYVGVKVNPSGTLPVDASGTPVSTKTDLTPSAPTAASVGVASAQAVAANANRKGLVLVNTSTARISLGFGSAAVLDSGITLYPQGSFTMDEFCFDLGAVNAIASAATSNLTIQEYTT